MCLPVPQREPKPLCVFWDFGLQSKHKINDLFAYFEVLKVPIYLLLKVDGAYRGICLK